MNKKLILFLFITLFAVGFAVYQYVKEFQSEFASATGTKPANGHLWSEMECDSSGLCVKSDGSVGIGTDSPSKKLEVNGDILASGTHDICNGAGACLSQIEDFIGAEPIAGGTAHNRTMCTAAGGTLITEANLANPICRFTATACPSGWTAYENWTATTAVATGGVSITCNGNTCSCPGGSTGSHTFSNVAREVNGIYVSLYWNTWCSCGYASPSSYSQACYINTSEGMYRGTQVGGLSSATITQIGCY